MVKAILWFYYFVLDLLILLNNGASVVFFVNLSCAQFLLSVYFITIQECYFL